MRDILKSAAAIFLVSMAVTGCQQETQEAKKDVSLKDEMRKERIAHEQKVYAEAMKAGDSYAAMHAVYSLLVDDTANALKHLDTLVTLYANLNLVEPALKTADRILAIDPANERMMDIRAGGDIAEGKGEEVVKRYREIYTKSNKLKDLFKVAQVQVQASELKDLRATISEFEKHPAFATDSVESQVASGVQKQKISAKAALLYLKGLEAVRAQNFTLAKKHMNEALKIQPDFFMAKEILDNLNRPVQAPR